MTEPVEPKAEFRSLAEDAVVSALQYPDPATPIAIEVARPIDGYTNRLYAPCRAVGPHPASSATFLRDTPSSTSKTQIHGRAR
jgi:hypothetical protein